ncbi:MAG: LysE family translocator [Rhodobacteraceae bacterium]|nr:LysE family translocator [Paracoccaceae bacterium]
MAELLPPPEAFWAFVLAGVLLNLAPGPDVIFATASGLAGGPWAGVAAGLGTSAGVLVHVALAGAGLAALLAALPGALEVLRWAGAAWLLWLGWKTWHAAAVGGAGRHGGPDAARAFGRAFLTNLANPKTILFVLAFLPQFADAARGPVGVQVLVLGAIFAATGAVVTSTYGAAAGMMGRALPLPARTLNRAAAVAFAALAARLIWE